LDITDKDSYITNPDRPRGLLSRIFLSWKHTFYPQLIWHVWVYGRRAARSPYSSLWTEATYGVFRALENVGIKFEITGIDNIRSFDGPAVFVGNHMSALEACVMPCIIQPLKPFTFVVKSDLLHIPVYKHLIRHGDPIIVNRKNPREDLKLVLEEGAEKLRKGISIVIFPQRTRTVVFKPEEFNTLGVKLAARAGVPVVPFALKTDAWGVGTFMRDFGLLDPTKKVYFSFGKPLIVNGNGSAKDSQIISFIQDKLDVWSNEEEPEASRELNCMN
jgi:1-acyl-sn-glycerol-3-phosphate acyltransferase